MKGECSNGDCAGSTKNDGRSKRRTIYEESFVMDVVILHQNYSTDSGGDECGDVTNNYPNKFKFSFDGWFKVPQKFWSSFCFSKSGPMRSK